MGRVEQYVMAYRTNPEIIDLILPEEFQSLRPVLRINAERIGEPGEDFWRIELNTPVSWGQMKGWLNLATWESNAAAIAAWKAAYGVSKSYARIKAEYTEQSVQLTAAVDEDPFLSIRFDRTGKEGGCPHEADNQGTFIRGKEGETMMFQMADSIDQPKEYCDCSFTWTSVQLPAKTAVWVRTIMSAKAEEILGAYTVTFERKGKN